MRNPNSENRNPKEARNPEAELGSAGTPAGVSSATNTSQLAGRGAAFPGTRNHAAWHLELRLRISFGFRISDFYPGGVEWLKLQQI